MSINMILNSYQTHGVPTSKDCVFNNHWLFYNARSDIYKIKDCSDMDFLVELLTCAATEEHDWCHVANFYNTKVKPYMLRTDYERLLNQAKLPCFKDLMDGSANDIVFGGKYVVWSNMSARFLGWLLYLKINYNITLSAHIPLFNHRDLGPVNLFSNSQINFDLFCSLKVDDKRWFQNGPHTDAPHHVMDVDINHEDSVRTVELKFGNHYVGSKNQILLNYLVNNDLVVACRFTDKFAYLGEIDLNRLRYDSVQVFLTDDGEEPVETCILPAKSDIKISPSSNFHEDFDRYIKECFDEIASYMCEAAPSNDFGENMFLLKYLELSEFRTFPYLIINVWKYCASHIKFQNQEKEEDIFLFLMLLCKHALGFANYRDEDFDEEEKRKMECLYEENFIYVASKDSAKKFLKSLKFFTEPQKALGYYFAIHFEIFKNTEEWNITSSLVKTTKLDDSVKSFGFFKKIKDNEVSYIFNGKIYEYVKNKKEHDIASLYEKADEIQTTTLKFNHLLNFYMTEDGMFDVCKKKFIEPCPFVIVSSLKKNFICKNQEFVDRRAFDAIFAAMKNDILLLKAYHAKKFERDFNLTKDGIRDCAMLDGKLLDVQNKLMDKLKIMIKSVLSYHHSDLVMLMIKLNLNDHLHNFISRGQDIDLLCLQLAVTLQLLWPNSSVTSYIWGYLATCYDEFLDIAEQCDRPILLQESLFLNKKVIIEKLHNYIRLNGAEMFLNNTVADQVEEFVQDLNIGSANSKKLYEANRVVKKINLTFNKLKKIPLQYNIWTDRLIEFDSLNDDMYSWLTRFYMRMYLNKLSLKTTNKNLLNNFIQGFCYFRLLTNFNITNSKAIINFCASLAIPTDYEKMCLVITSEPNCGKSSLFELLDKIILVYKCDRHIYDLNNQDKSSRIKRFESQLYIMNEAEIMSKGYLKSIADSTKFEFANKKYGPEEYFCANYKVMITNNDMLFIRDGYDKACSNRIGQIYIDHSFESDIEPFNGSIYENYIRKRYHEIKDINSKLTSPVTQFLGNVLYYNSDPKTGFVYYKNILQGDKCYKHNKKCLYIYNNTLEALLYVLDIKEVKGAPGFTEAILLDMITKCVNIVKHMVHYKMHERCDESRLFGEFRKKYGKSRFFNADTCSYENLTIAKSEKYFRKDRPKFKSNIDDDMM
ncbi:ORF79 [Agrotis segetum granulovirus]|uniref:Helicase-1 n=1 Tax=Agrotis segetum granulosis virus TaxID=10464 RepID=Q6QXM0_GVAS|nr:DNA helicase-1 [Agrotis segetum granulovirus]AAS82658.1 ORF79 [Agrotis segetum granulovirus]AHN92130.1 helicase-1 [Agrotis segetum granulovirus]AKN63366.1 DNA helicase-1 [Agrotis segetum granulovirus]